MADNSARTPGSGETIRTVDKSGVETQAVVIDLGGTGAEVLWTGDADYGAQVDPRLHVVRVAATPTITAGAYAAGDQVGGINTLTSVVRANGGSGAIVNAVVIDKGVQAAELELWLFRISPTLAGSDNNAFDIADGPLVAATPAGVIRFATYYSATSSSVALADTGTLPLGFTCAAADANLYGVFVTRSAPTYASTSDLVVALFVVQD